MCTRAGRSTSSSGHCQTRQRPHVENEEKKHKKPSYETGAGFISLGNRGEKTPHDVTLKSRVRDGSFDYVC